MPPVSYEVLFCAKQGSYCGSLGAKTTYRKQSLFPCIEGKAILQIALKCSINAQRREQRAVKREGPTDTGVDL